MTQPQLLAALAPARLPAGMASMSWREGAGLIGLGLLAGLALFLMIRPLLIRRPSRRHQIRATRGLPPQERILAVARILGHLPEPLRAAAYGPQPVPDDDRIERIALRRSRTRG